MLGSILRVLGLARNTGGVQCSNCGKRNSTVREKCFRCHERL